VPGSVDGFAGTTEAGLVDAAPAPTTVAVVVASLCTGAEVVRVEDGGAGVSGFAALPEVSFDVLTPSALSFRAYSAASSVSPFFMSLV
jgi:hypothetical protein